MNEHQMPVAPATHFGALPVDHSMAGTLAGMGYTQPTPIQEQAIPPLRAGHDVIGLARTGSGKTAGFGIPLIESVRTTERRVQVLVLVPTRELASQVAGELTKLGAARRVRVLAVYGGVGMGAQISGLSGNAHIVVGTPGRVIDHLTRGTMDLRHTRTVVLDEADRMLDVGFAPAIEDILRRIPTPRQVALFSATFPAEVEALAGRHTRSAVRISVDEPGAAIETLEQRFMRVPEGKEKADVLHDILIGQECGLALVFRRTTHKTDKLARDLERRGFKVAALHGRRTQAQRERALEALRGGRLQVLVATDIAARGLDITGLTHVVNFDLPDTAENYTHRIGRTARMGADGIAITLVSPEDEESLRAIQRRLGPGKGAGAADAASPGVGRAARERRRPERGQGTSGARRPAAAARPHRAAPGGASTPVAGTPATGNKPADRAARPQHGHGPAQGRPAPAATTPRGGEGPRQADRRQGGDEQGWYPFNSVYAERPRR